MTEHSTVILGAFERDNFGDLLFGLRSREYLRQSPARFAAAFRGQVDDIFGASVEAYSSAIRADSPSGIWIAGGEVGGVTLPVAYSMYAHASPSSKPSLRRNHVRDLEALSGLDRYSMPYLPRMSASAATLGSTCVINSVGLRHMKRLRGTNKHEAWQSIREASFVSVRDEESSRMLRKENIEHVLAPDLIHSIRLQLVQPAAKPGYALFQLRSSDLRQLGPRAVAERLVKCGPLSTFEVRLFSAGTAPGHDSLDEYREVVREVRRLSPGRAISISSCIRPLEKVAEIAASSLWIGTSLHGLIVSTAFEVPRVGLMNPKVSHYAETWSEKMPFDVPIDQLDVAISEAMALGGSSEESLRSTELADLADRSARQAATTIESHRANDIEIVQHRRADADEFEARRRSNLRVLIDRSQPPRQAIRSAGGHTLRAMGVRR